MLYFRDPNMHKYTMPSIWHTPKVYAIKIQIEGMRTPVGRSFRINQTPFFCYICIVFTFRRVLFYCLRLTLSFGWAPAKPIPALCFESIVSRSYCLGLG